MSDSLISLQLWSECHQSLLKHIQIQCVRVSWWWSASQYFCVPHNRGQVCFCSLCILFAKFFLFLVWQKVTTESQPFTWITSDVPCAVYCCPVCLSGWCTLWTALGLVVWFLSETSQQPMLLVEGCASKWQVSPLSRRKTLLWWNDFRQWASCSCC